MTLGLVQDGLSVVGISIVRALRLVRIFRLIRLLRKIRTLRRASYTRVEGGSGVLGRSKTSVFIHGFIIFVDLC